jgi:ABC-2 type transport system ATP-binding protein
MATFRTRARTVLSPHYMEEAEQLCDRVAIVDHGKVIAQGTQRLIATLGAQYVVEFGVADGARRRIGALGLGGVVAVRHEEGRWRLQVAELHMVVPACWRCSTGRVRRSPS